LLLEGKKIRLRQLTRREIMAINLYGGGRRRKGKEPFFETKKKATELSAVEWKKEGKKRGRTIYLLSPGGGGRGRGGKPALSSIIGKKTINYLKSATTRRGEKKRAPIISLTWGGKGGGVRS